MLSALTTALQNDCVDIVVKKIQQGTYVEPTLAKAIKQKAWKTTAWIMTKHPDLVHANLFNECSAYPLNLTYDTLSTIIDNSLEKDTLAKWLRAMVVWEQAHGSTFTMEQFEKKWSGPSNAHYVRKSMEALAKLHRFDVVNAWLEDVEKDSSYFRWANDLWRSVLTSMDSKLLHWLLERASLEETIEFCRNAINGVQLSLLREDTSQENANWLWRELLHKLSVEPEQLLSYMAVYDRSTVRTLWSLFGHVEHSVEWRNYFEARSDGQHVLAPNPLIDILSSLYTDTASKLNHLIDASRLKSGITLDTNFCI